MEPIRINSLDPATRDLPIVIGEGEGERHMTVRLRRPARAGISRIPGRMALAMRNDYGTNMVHQLDGRGLQMDAVLREYVVELPDELAVLDEDGKQLLDGDRPIIDAERIAPELYAALGEAAVAWHETFRSVDVRFSAGGGAQA